MLHEFHKMNLFPINANFKRIKIVLVCQLLKEEPWCLSHNWNIFYVWRALQVLLCRALNGLDCIWILCLALVLKFCWLNVIWSVCHSQACILWRPTYCSKETLILKIRSGPNHIISDTVKPLYHWGQCTVPKRHLPFKTRKWIWIGNCLLQLTLYVLLDSCALNHYSLYGAYCVEVRAVFRMSFFPKTLFRLFFRLSSTRVWLINDLNWNSYQQYPDCTTPDWPELGI